MGALLVVAADVAVLFPGLVLIPLLVEDAAAVGAEQQTGEQAHFIIAVWTLALLTQLLHTLPCVGVDDRLVGVLENDLLFLRVFHAGLHLVGHLLRLEVDQMPQILLAFQDMDDSIGRPLTLIAGVVAAGAARPAVLKRPRRGDLLLGEDAGYLGGAVPRKAQAVYLPYHGGGFLIDDKASVLSLEVAVDGLTGQGLAAHALASENCLDFPARISHHPFVKKIFQRR